MPKGKHLFRKPKKSYTQAAEETPLILRRNDEGMYMTSPQIDDDNARLWREQQSRTPDRPPVNKESAVFPAAGWPTAPTAPGANDEDGIMPLAEALLPPPIPPRAPGHFASSHARYFVAGADDETLLAPSDDSSSSSSVPTPDPRVLNPDLCRVFPGHIHTAAFPVDVTSWANHVSPGFESDVSMQNLNSGFTGYPPAVMSLEDPFGHSMSPVMGPHEFVPMNGFMCPPSPYLKPAKPVSQIDPRFRYEDAVKSFESGDHEFVADDEDENGETEGPKRPNNTRAGKPKEQGQCKDIAHFGDTLLPAPLFNGSSKVKRLASGYDELSKGSVARGASVGVGRVGRVDAAGPATSAAPASSVSLGRKRREKGKGKGKAEVNGDKIGSH